MFINQWNEWWLVSYLGTAKHLNKINIPSLMEYVTDSNIDKSKLLINNQAKTFTKTNEENIQCSLALSTKLPLTFQSNLICLGFVNIIDNEGNELSFLTVSPPGGATSNWVYLMHISCKHLKNLIFCNFKKLYN